MERCPNYSICKFSKILNEERNGIKKWIYSNFCCDEYHDCARYAVSETLGAEKVPDELYPVRWDKAQQYLHMTHEFDHVFTPTDMASA